MVLDMRLAEKMARIKHLKREKRAVILAHNYQRPEVQDVADFLGDSLDLALHASKTDADVIIFCGVDFMAESAKIICPDKIVVHPSLDARCPMAAMVNLRELRALKRAYPDAATVAYVNTSAETKVEADICCTSTNAVRVVKSVDTDKVIFVPDVNLGLYIQRFVQDKEFVYWNGYCHVHQDLSGDAIRKLKKLHPNAEVLVHPECIPEVIDLADFTYSTQGMVKHVANSDATEFIIGTERELCYRLKKENPNKTFYPIETAVCPAMKTITIDKVLASLETLQPQVTLSDRIIKRAKRPLLKMLVIGRGD
jgi:quinolinate synthase